MGSGVRGWIAFFFFMAFPFESLEVYQRATRFNEDVQNVLERNRGLVSRSIADQLIRASLSIPLNIAEGNGRWHKADKRQFFWVARGSVFECVPIFTILKIKNLVTDDENEKLREQLEILGKMLTRIIQAHEA